MSTPQEKNFEDYKKAEKRALEILEEMKKVSPRKVDIELSLLTAVFELHRGLLPPATVGRIVQGHLNTLVPFYEEEFKNQRDN